MQGSQRFKEIFEKYKSRPVLLYGDPDPDGLFSLLLMAQFCDMMGIKYQYFVNSRRYHGFQLKVSSIEGYLVIASDFAIKRDEIQFLVDNNVTILSTDHHDVKDEFIDIVGDTSEGIVINNQYSFEPDGDRYLSGAGVFYELICSIYPEFASKERQAIVGITLLTDLRQIENNKARQYLKATYSIDSTQGYANYLIKSTVESDYGFGVPKLDRNFIDYTLSPCINALLRADRTDEAIEFILGAGMRPNTTRSTQRSLVSEMELRAQILQYPSLHILSVNTSDFYDFSMDITGYIGLFCSDYKDRHNNVSTLGFVIDNGKVVRASFRGRYDDVHYLAGVQNLGIDADGHPPAFGIKNLTPSMELFQDLSDLVTELDENHQRTYKIVESSNLAIVLTQRGMTMAMENCYVRDMYRTYIKYTGKNIKIKRQTYRTEEFSMEDYASGTKADVVSGSTKFKYVLDAQGNPLPKYIEYLVDGRTVKSFGVSVEEGVILPMLEKGYLTLYVRSALE